jgi:nucleoside-diphosphate-sugar epimerase
MRILIVGATGALGKRLVPLLIAAGHEVVATTRTVNKMQGLHSVGAEPILLDLLDRDAVKRAVQSARPDAVVHQASSLARMRSLKHFDNEFGMTNRLRVEGTENLMAAALAVGTRRFVAQSYTGWPNERSGDRIKTEADRLDTNPPQSMIRTLQAIQGMEQIVSGARDITGIVLRYGSFYGPGTSVCPGGDIVEAVRQRKFPIIGNGAGIWSWAHIDDCARATQSAIEHGSAGIYNIVDDDPAEVSRWLPDLAQAFGAKPPLHLPAWLGRLLIGEARVSMMTKIRGSSNAKAKEMLAWRPTYASWRDGFRRGVDADHPATGHPVRTPRA